MGHITFCGDGGYFLLFGIFKKVKNAKPKNVKPDLCPYLQSFVWYITNTNSQYCCPEVGCVDPGSVGLGWVGFEFS